MNHQEATLYLQNNLKSFEEKYPSNIFIISPFLQKDIEKFIKAINEKGLQNISVIDYSSDGRFGVQAFLYKAI